MAGAMHKFLAVPLLLPLLLLAAETNVQVAKFLDISDDVVSSSQERRELLEQHCDQPDSEEWCTDIPAALCNSTTELGTLIRGTCPTSCRACLDDTETIAQNKILQNGGSVEFRTGFLLSDPSLSPYTRSFAAGWDLWLERSGALAEGIEVGNGRVRIKHTTIVMPLNATCDDFTEQQRVLIQDRKIQAAVIPTHTCKTMLSKAYHEAGVVHFLLSGTQMADKGSPYSNKHAWYTYLDSNDNSRLFLKTMAQESRKMAVVWWTGHAWTATSAAYVIENYVSQYELELVYSWGWPKEAGGVEVSGSSEDGSYVELYDTAMWDDMLTDIVEAGTEILLIFCRGEGVSIMNRIKQRGLNFKGIFMTVAPVQASWAARLGTDGDFVIAPAQWSHQLQSPCVLFGDVNQYSVEFMERFGYVPDFPAAAGTASGLALQLAMQTFGSLEQILGGLQTMSHDTMFGRMKFSYSQRNIGRSPVNLQRQNTELIMIFPEELSSPTSTMLEVVNWECRPLYFDSDKDVCTDEEFGQFEDCKLLYPSMTNTGCQARLESQAQDAYFSSAGLAALIIGINVMCCMGILVYFVFVRRKSVHSIKIEFSELTLESEKIQMGDGDIDWKLRNKLHATWRGTQVLLIRRPKLSPLRISSEGQGLPHVQNAPSDQAASQLSIPSRTSGSTDPVEIGSVTVIDSGTPATRRCPSANKALNRSLSRIVKPDQKARTNQVQSCHTQHPAGRYFGQDVSHRQGLLLSSDTAAVAQLRHPNLLTVLGATVAPSGTEYLVVESMALGCLRDCLQNDYAHILDENAVQHVLKDVVAGVQFLHESNTAIIHGSIRSKNILLDEKLTAKVRTDVNVLGSLGLFAEPTDLTASTNPRNFAWTSRLGKLSKPADPNTRAITAWTAPEVLVGGPESTMSDIYALGVTIWELFSRRDPYEHWGVKSPLHLPDRVVDAVVNANARPDLPDEMPRAIRELVTRCWHADPMARPSITEVANIVNKEKVAPLRPMQQLHQSRNLLHQMLPPHVAAALGEGRKVEPEHFKCVTIFFSDIVGYTDISASLPPQKVMGLLDRLYQHFDKLTRAHGLFKVETIGDAYMCVGGLPAAQPDHAARVAMFALEAVQAANQVLIDEEDPERGHVNIRAGFHSGPVVASVVGDLNPRYCLFGDTVNCASRMESNSKPNCINLSLAATVLLMAQCNAADIPLSLHDRGKVDIKGKGRMRCYFLESMEMPAQGWQEGAGDFDEAIHRSDPSFTMSQHLSTLPSTAGHSLRTSLHGDEGLADHQLPAPETPPIVGSENV